MQFLEITSDGSWTEENITAATARAVQTMQERRSKLTHITREAFGRLITPRPIPDALASFRPYAINHRHQGS